MKATNEQLEELSAYLDGELPPPERAMVESQLAANAGLRGELESLRRTVDSVRGMPRAKAPAGLADEVVDRLARRELLDDGASRGGEVARFVIHLRRFAVAAVIVLAAGVGWRYWSASSNPPVIGESAAPTASVPGAAEPIASPDARGRTPVGGLAKTELAARTQDRDAAALNERTESAEGAEKLAFGNQVPGGAIALDTRAKAMGSDNGGPRGFSTRADAMLPTDNSPVMAKASAMPVESAPNASILGSPDNLPSPSATTQAVVQSSSRSRADEFGVSSRFSFGVLDGFDNSLLDGAVATQFGTAEIQCTSFGAANDVCQRLITDAYKPDYIFSAAPECPLSSATPQFTNSPPLQILLRGRRSAVARYLLASARADSRIELKLVPYESVLAAQEQSDGSHSDRQKTLRAGDVVSPQPDGDPRIGVVVAVLPVKVETQSAPNAP